MTGGNDGDYSNVHGRGLSPHIAGMLMSIHACMCTHTRTHRCRRVRARTHTHTCTMVVAGPSQISAVT